MAGEVLVVATNVARPGETLDIRELTVSHVRRPTMETATLLSPRPHVAIHAVVEAAASATTSVRPSGRLPVVDEAVLIATDLVLP